MDRGGVSARWFPRVPSCLLVVRRSMVSQAVHPCGCPSGRPCPPLRVSPVASSGRGVRRPVVLFPRFPCRRHPCGCRRPSRQAETVSGYVVTRHHYVKVLSVPGVACWVGVCPSSLFAVAGRGRSCPPCGVVCPCPSCRPVVLSVVLSSVSPKLLISFHGSPLAGCPSAFRVAHRRGLFPFVTLAGVAFRRPVGRSIGKGCRRCRRGVSAVSGVSAVRGRVCSPCPAVSRSGRRPSCRGCPRPPLRGVVVAVSVRPSPLAGGGRFPPSPYSTMRGSCLSIPFFKKNSDRSRRPYYIIG